MQEWLARAAVELGLRVNIGYYVVLSDGTTTLSQAHFPDLGHALGTLVFETSSEVNHTVRQELQDLGYVISIFGSPHPNEVFDLNGYAEMFADWGWGGDANQQPIWMSAFTAN